MLSLLLLSCLFSSVFDASLLWLEEAAELDEAALELEELDEDEDFSLELELDFEELELELDLTLEVTAELEAAEVSLLEET